MWLSSITIGKRSAAKAVSSQSCQCYYLSQQSPRSAALTSFLQRCHRTSSSSYLKQPSQLAHSASQECSWAVFCAKLAVKGVPVEVCPAKQFGTDGKGKGS
eukprot:5237122-Amphidinium_carterae.1